VSDSQPAAPSPEDAAPTDPAADALFSRSLWRIERFIPILAVAIAAVLLWRGQAGPALGFLAGAAVAYINFRWLKSTVMTLADAVTQSGMHSSRPRVVLRFLMRFVLIALVAYGIFVSYPAAFHGFLGGLFVPVLAIFVEAAYVVRDAIRQGH
jgi:hypothetical protein